VSETLPAKEPQAAPRVTRRVASAPDADRAPVTAGALLTRTFQTWWRHLGSLAVLALLFHLPALAAFLWLRSPLLWALARRMPLGAAWGIATYGTIWLIVMPLGVLAQAATTAGIVRWLDGQPVGAVTMLGLGARRLWAVLPAALLVLLAIVGAWLLLWVPGVMVAVATSVAIPAAAAERLGPKAAFRRSLELTRGHRWSIFGAFLAMLALCVTAGALGAQLSNTTSIAFVPVSHAAGLLAMSIASVLPAVTFHLLRAAKEGPATSGLAEVFEQLLRRGAAPAPLP